MTEALKHLLNYQQADEDGVMVMVSRQAIHEVADQLTAAQARIGILEDGLRPFAMQVENVHEKDENEWSIVDPQWQHPSAVFLTIGDLRRAARALSPAMKETGMQGVDRER